MIKTTSKGKSPKLDLSRSFAPVHETEVYRHAGGLYDVIAFDVTKAWEIVDAWTPEQRKARFETRSLSLSSLQEHQLDTRKAMDADLNIPVLWVSVTEINPRTAKPYTWFRMIDGYSRAYKSFKTKRSLKLPAFVLNPEESASCRILYDKKGRRVPVALATQT